ncbi:MAG: OmpW/AlkL family protein [Moraxellaceae bacterium]
MKYLQPSLLASTLTLSAALFSTATLAADTDFQSPDASPPSSSPPSSSPPGATPPEPPAPEAFTSGLKPAAVEDELYRHKISLGALMLRPQGEGHGLNVSIPTATVPAAENFTVANIETQVGDANTVGIFYSYAIDTHWGIEFFGGIPPEVELYGKGVLNAPVTVVGGQLQNGGATPLLDVGDPANNPIATAKAWAPALIGTYSFFDTKAGIRPYIGLGLCYGFLTDIKINPNITQALNDKGALLALITGNPDASTVSVEGEADPFLSVVGTLGVDMNLTEKLGLKASASYIPSSTDVRLKIRDSKGMEVAEISTNIPIDPLIFFVAVSYRFSF